MCLPQMIPRFCHEDTLVSRPKHGTVHTNILSISLTKGISTIYLAATAY